MEKVRQLSSVRPLQPYAISPPSCASLASMSGHFMPRCSRELDLRSLFYDFFSILGYAPFSFLSNCLVILPRRKGGDVQSSAS